MAASHGPAISAEGFLGDRPSFAVRVKALEESVAAALSRGKFPTLPIRISGVRRQEFDETCAARDRWGCSVEYNNGDVLIYEWPSHVHCAVAAEVIKQLTSAIGGHANDISMVTDFRCAFDGFSCEPDAAFTADGKPRLAPGALYAADNLGSPFPNVILEVAYSEELEHVQTKARLWLGPLTTVQQVIVIKVGYEALPGGGRELLAFSYIRGAAANPVQSIEFSYPAHQLAAAGAAGMQLHIPLPSLYAGVPGVAPVGLVPPAMDLFWIQRRVQLTPGF